MSNIHNQTITCQCGKEHEVEVIFSLNIQEHPEYEEKIQNHSINTVYCECGQTTILEGVMIYVDPAHHLMIQTLISRPNPNFDFILARQQFLHEIKAAKQLLNEKPEAGQFDYDAYTYLSVGNLYELGALIRATKDGHQPAAIQFLGQVIKYEKACPGCAGHNTTVYYLGLSDEGDQLIYLLNCLDCTEKDYYYYTFPLGKYREIEANLVQLSSDAEQIKAVYPNILNFSNEDPNKETPSGETPSNGKPHDDQNNE
jgi:hypothetical protein